MYQPGETLLISSDRLVAIKNAGLFVLPANEDVSPFRNWALVHFNPMKIGESAEKVKPEGYTKSKPLFRVTYDGPWIIPISIFGFDFKRLFNLGVIELNIGSVKKKGLCVACPKFMNCKQEGMQDDDLDKFFECKGDWKFIADLRARQSVRQKKRSLPVVP